MDEGVDLSIVGCSNDYGEVGRDVFWREGAGDSVSGFWEVWRERGTDSRDSSTTAQESVCPARGYAATSDNEDEFSLQVNHHREIWRSRN